MNKQQWKIHSIVLIDRAEGFFTQKWLWEWTTTAAATATVFRFVSAQNALACRRIDTNSERNTQQENNENFLFVSQVRARERARVRKKARSKNMHTYRVCECSNVCWCVSFALYVNCARSLTFSLSRSVALPEHFPNVISLCVRVHKIPWSLVNSLNRMETDQTEGKQNVILVSQ